MENIDHLQAVEEVAPDSPAMTPEEFIQEVDRIVNSIKDQPPALVKRLFSPAARRKYNEIQSLTATAERAKINFVEQYLAASAPKYAKAEENASRLRSIATHYKTYIELTASLTCRHAEEIAAMYTGYSQALASIKNTNLSDELKVSLQDILSKVVNETEEIVTRGLKDGVDALEDELIGMIKDSRQVNTANHA